MRPTRILAVMIAATALAGRADAQDAARVYSTRDVAPPQCSCVGAPGAAATFGASVPWLMPSLGLEVKPGVWLGMDMPPSLSTLAPPAPSGFGTPSAAGAAEGGLSLEITPADAELWVDGALAGPARDFGPLGRPLPLPAGVHRIELRAVGFVPLIFDILTTPNYVLPYRGSLRPEP